MLNRRKLAAGLGGLTLMLGTIGGGIAVYAASPASSPPAVVQPAEADTETAEDSDTDTTQDQQGAQVEDNTPDTGAGAQNGPDTDNVQDGSGSQVEDGTSDVPGAVTP